MSAPPPKLPPPPPKKSVPKPAAADNVVDEKEKEPDVPVTVTAPPKIPPPPPKKSVPKPAAADNVIDEKEKEHEVPITVTAPPKALPVPSPKTVPGLSVAHSPIVDTNVALKLPPTATSPFSAESIVAPKSIKEPAGSVKTTVPVPPSKLTPVPLKTEILKPKEPIGNKFLDIPQGGIEAAKALLKSGNASVLTRPGVEGTHAFITGELSNTLAVRPGVRAVSEITTPSRDSKKVDICLLETTETQSYQELKGEEQDAFILLFYEFSNRINSLRMMRYEVSTLILREGRKRDSIVGQEHNEYVEYVILPLQQLSWIFTQQMTYEKESKERNKTMLLELTTLQKKLYEDVKELQTEMVKTDRTHTEQAFKTMADGIINSTSSSIESQVKEMKENLRNMELKLEEELSAVVVLQREQRDRLGLNKSAFQKQLEEDGRERERAMLINDQLNAVKKGIERERKVSEQWADRCCVIFELVLRECKRNEIDCRDFIEDSERHVRKSILRLFDDTLDGYRSSVNGITSFVGERSIEMSPYRIGHAANHTLSCQEYRNPLYNKAPSQAAQMGTAEVARFFHTMLGYSEEVACEYGILFSEAGYGAACFLTAPQYTPNAGIQDSPGTLFPEGRRLLKRLTRTPGWEELMDALTQVSFEELGFPPKDFLISGEQRSQMVNSNYVRMSSVGERRVFMSKIQKLKVKIEMAKREDHEEAEAVKNLKMKHEREQDLEINGKPKLDCDPNRYVGSVESPSLQPKSPSPNPRQDNLDHRYEQRQVVTLTSLDSFMNSVMEHSIPQHDKLMFEAWSHIIRHISLQSSARSNDISVNRNFRSVEKQWVNAWRYAWQNDLADQNEWKRQMDNIRRQIVASISDEPCYTVSPVNGLFYDDILVDPIAKARRQCEEEEQRIKRGEVSYSSRYGPDPIFHGHRLQVLSQCILSGYRAPPAYLVPKQ